MKRNLTPLEIGISLEDFFSKKGLSQVEVGRKYGVAQSWIGRIYAGKFSEPSDLIKKMCREANIPITGLTINSAERVYAIRLTKLLAKVWTGTPEDARFLIKALQTLKKMRNS
jgi:transcriptional regulator with XRE-family HTH domain